MFTPAFEIRFNVYLKELPHHNIINNHIRHCFIKAKPFCYWGDEYNGATFMRILLSPC